MSASRKVGSHWPQSTWAVVKWHAVVIPGASFTLLGARPMQKVGLPNCRVQREHFIGLSNKRPKELKEVYSLAFRRLCSSGHPCLAVL
jgi:hypothetical protein